MATAINRVFPAEPPQQVRESDAQPIAVVLDELLARYQARFPGANIVVVRTAEER